MSAKPLDKSNLYDRQERVIGKDAMQKLFETKLLLVGLGGLGVEIAKNLILMGVRNVTLFDTKNTTNWDLSSQFFLSEEHLGQNRATSCVQKLRELNEFCQVDILSLPNATSNIILDEQILLPFSVVIVTDECIPHLVAMNQICRKNNIKFIAAETRGVFGSCFVDFGSSFIVKDTNGELPSNGVVVSITVDQDGHGIVETFDKESSSEKVPHGLETGDLVIFSGVEGMTELNDGQPRNIKRIDLTRFDIGDVSGFKPYTTGGYFYQIKKPLEMQFNSLEYCLQNVTCSMFYDYSKMEYPSLLNLSFLALAKFVNQQQQFPQPYHEEDAKLLVQIAHELNQQFGNSIQIIDSVVKQLSYTCIAQLNPMTTLFGGIVAQEAQKAVTQKFSPIFQSFFFEALDCLPESIPTVELENNRYDSQIAVFGNKLHSRLENLKYFLVGAGALGCEFMKNFAMMGIGCGPRGLITLTDMDCIEVSNLSRQFLFREKHVGKFKSEIAGQSAKEMNSSLNYKAMQDKVAHDTEEIFDDKFWEQLDGVMNALDNVEARLYVDSRCVYYRKSLLESGTLGPKAHAQVIVPYLTESYGSQRDAPQKEFPKCTIHQFPNVIQHTISWASELFYTFFNSGVQQANNFLKNPEHFLETIKGNIFSIETVYEYLIELKPRNFADCVQLARRKFEELFTHAIQNILHNYPPDKKTESGAAFWSGAKRCPTPAAFSLSDETHKNFVLSTANLFAQVYGIEIDDSVDYNNLCITTKLPSFAQTVLETEEEMKDEERQRAKAEKAAQDNKEYFEKLERALLSMNREKVNQLHEIEFEKDDDSNFHMDFITSASNLRARCYKIPEADKYKTKGIAGNIIPAMITTTALVTGLICLELYKLVQQKPLEKYRNSFVNIAVPFITSSEPSPAPKTHANRWTLWDRFEINKGRDITLQELVDIMKSEYRIEVAAINYGQMMLYTLFMNEDIAKARLAANISWLIEKMTGTKFSAKQKYIVLNIHGSDANGEYLSDIPIIRYQFRFPKENSLVKKIVKK